jgi:tRNA (guanine-N7-)-methyltransferase
MCLSKVDSAGALIEPLLRHPFLAIEIGCGVGLHPIKYANEFPNRAMIAIERTTAKYLSFSRRLDRHCDLRNRLCAVHADAFQFMDEVLPNKSVDEVWILYPNPEPKKASRRWFFTPFTSRLIDFLKPDATIHLATNIESYAADCTNRAADYGLSVKKYERFDKSSRPDWVPRTHFEKKYYERGEVLFDMEFA